jgi:hypothetical protein
MVEKEMISIHHKISSFPSSILNKIDMDTIVVAAITPIVRFNVDKPIIATVIPPIAPIKCNICLVLFLNKSGKIPTIDNSVPDIKNNGVFQPKPDVITANDNIKI